jgi:anti-sigma factor RsiW
MTDDPHQLAAAYALDAVEPEEARRFEAHLQSCPRCAAEVADFRATAAQLAGAAATPPPTAMRDRVLARAAITRQQSPHVRRSSQPAASRRCWRRPSCWLPCWAWG